MYCIDDFRTILISDADGIAQEIDYEVIRSQYISRPQPDMTRLSFNQTRTRMGMEYHCTVVVIGRRNIASGTYGDDILGTGTSSITVTGK